MTDERMLKIIEESTATISEGGDTINARVKLSKFKVDADKRELLAEYDVQPWALNPAGTLHGGIISSALDISMACVLYPFAGGFVPTIELTVVFHRPVSLGETLEIQARIVESGSTIAHAEARARIRRTGKLVASAKGIYSMKTWTSYLDGGGS
ncbi:MAG: PaaI family thioesterase [Clostridiales Family XIII bacterium]|jgi:uncharacterized protein (TIGR00369 family)|nr:PaaI family thioesterase [Clostridiales Family XIII bacterium]